MKPLELKNHDRSRKRKPRQGVKRIKRSRKRKRRHSPRRRKNKKTKRTVKSSYRKCPVSSRDHVEYNSSSSVLNSKYSPSNEVVNSQLVRLHTLKPDIQDTCKVVISKLAHNAAQQGLQKYPDNSVGNAQLVFSAQLSKKNLQIKNCLGDGNCLFRAVGYCVYGSSILKGTKTEIFHPQLRLAIMTLVRSMGNF